MDSLTWADPERKFRKGEPCPLIEDGKICGKPIFVEMHGWCGMHYARYRTHGDPLHKVRRYVRRGEKCTAPQGCENKPKKDNLCHKHARLMELYGETTDPRERKFWAQVDKSAGPDTCWPWTGCLQSGGYGAFGTKGERLAHRVAYGYLVGPPPPGRDLDHLCHTNDPDCPGRECEHRRCCNPAHLEPITRRENIARGRGGDSWGYVPDAVPVKHEQLALPICIRCGRGDKPIYKSGRCRRCYNKRHEDPTFKVPPKLTTEERFWEKVDKRGPLPFECQDLGPCWVWTASINKGTGYGQFFPKHGEGMDAHRFAYLLEHGSIPEKHDVHHLCLRRACVRPSHLRATTRSENLAERMNRRSR
jgi:hypothetical protein